MPEVCPHCGDPIVATAPTLSGHLIYIHGLTTTSCGLPVVTVCARAEDQAQVQQLVLGIGKVMELLRALRRPEAPPAAPFDIRFIEIIENSWPLEYHPENGGHE